MSVLPIESRRVSNLNVLLLFFVSIEPFLFNLMRSPPTVANPHAYFDAASTLYGLDLGAMFLILGFFTFNLAATEKKLVPPELTRRFKLETMSWFTSGAVFLISALPVFFTMPFIYGLPIRIYVWFVPLIIPRVTNTYLGLSRKESIESTGGNRKKFAAPS